MMSEIDKGEDIGWISEESLFDNMRSQNPLSKN